MKSEIPEERLEALKQEKARWLAVIQQWDQMTLYTPIPMFTREYAEKMIKKLDGES